VPFAALSRDVPYRLNVRFESPEEFTVIADYRPGEGELAREAFGFAAHLQRQKSAPPKSLATWSGRFAPVSPLPSGIIVARDTTAMVAPFGKGNFSGPIRHAAEITALCPIADGIFASGSADGEIKLWRLPPPAFTSTPQIRVAPARESRELLARSRDAAAVELWTEREPVPDAPADPNAPPAMIDRKQKLIVTRAGKSIEVNLGSPPVAKRISNGALTADGKRAVFSGEAEIEHPEDVSGAWVFSTDHPEKLSSSLSHCSWAGFTPDGRYVLTVHNGQLVFWEEGPTGPDGGARFKRTGQVLPQPGMKSVVLADGGSHLATWSGAGEVIVWDTVKWAPVHRFTSDPLWNTGDWSNCEPALSRDGRRLATAYDRAFVIWDVTSGKRLSDPIYCPARLERLAFVGPGSARIEATVSTDDERSQMSPLTWDYADVSDVLDEKAIGHLRQLAAWVAGGDWASRVPEFAPQTVGDPKVVKALFAHFASQSRVERSSAQKAADQQSAR
jgi:WD40 repeat protein